MIYVIIAFSSLMIIGMFYMVYRNETKVFPAFRNDIKVGSTISFGQCPPPMTVSAMDGEYVTLTVTVNKNKVYP